MGGPQVRYIKPEGLEGLELLSCPDVNYLFPPHFHEAYCIWLNSSGGEHYRHRGNSSILQPNQFGIIAPGEVHENYACRNNRRNLLTFYLTQQQLQTVADQVSDGKQRITEFRTAFYHDEESRCSLINLHQVLNQSTDKLERETAFLELLELLIRHHAITPAPERPCSPDTGRASRLVERFHDCYDENPSLSQLAEELGCTAHHLIRTFKQSVGLSPHAYLVQLRLEKAKELIGRGHAIVDIALAAGFVDQSHLTRHFKRKFGIPPGLYRQQIFH